VVPTRSFSTFIPRFAAFFKRITPRVAWLDHSCQACQKRRASYGVYLKKKPIHIHLEEHQILKREDNNGRYDSRSGDSRYRDRSGNNCPWPGGGAGISGKPDDILNLRKSLGFFYKNPKEDADRNNHSGMLMIGTEPLMRWAHCPGGSKPEWLATVIRTEMDAPLTGSVAGVTQADVAFRTKEPVNQTGSAHVHK
jgi:hypothetical protein